MNLPMHDHPLGPCPSNCAQRIYLRELKEKRDQEWLAAHPEMQLLIDELKEHPYMKAISEAFAPKKPSLWQRILGRAS